jgi:hypothetical protein
LEKKDHLFVILIIFHDLLILNVKTPRVKTRSRLCRDEIS